LLNRNRESRIEQRTVREHPASLVDRRADPTERLWLPLWDPAPGNEDL